jgi:hypothetical protein
MLDADPNGWSALIAFFGMVSAIGVIVGPIIAGYRAKGGEGRPREDPHRRRGLDPRHRGGDPGTQGPDRGDPHAGQRAVRGQGSPDQGTRSRGRGTQEAKEVSPSQTGGYQDDREEEREALWHDIPEELPQGALDPWEGWPEEPVRDRNTGSTAGHWREGNYEMAERPDRPDDDDDDAEWPDPPYVGFVPLDDRLEDRKHTRRQMEEVWKTILKRWASPWKDTQ